MNAFNIKDTKPMQWKCNFSTKIKYLFLTDCWKIHIPLVRAEDQREVTRMSLSKVGNQTSSQDPQAVNSR